MKKVLVFILPLFALTSFTAKMPATGSFAGMQNKKATITLSVVCYSQAGIAFDVFSLGVDNTSLVADGYSTIEDRMLHYWGFTYTVSSGEDKTTGKTLDPSKSWGANGVHGGDDIYIFGAIE